VEKERVIWIKGAGDIGSAIAHLLRREGLAPILVERPAPVVSRRRMAFASALHEGELVLEGVRGVRCTGLEAALACLAEEDCVPVLEREEVEAPEGLSPAVVVDARMRKKEQPPPQIEEAPLVIGIGPGFEAGVHAHAAVESNWGEQLGRVIREGAAMAYTGQPREVEGFARERYLYAPHAGIFRTRHDVTDRVEAGGIVGQVDDTPLRAAIAGILRGVAHDGVAVTQGAKLAEVDPRGEARYCVGISERPGRIADGVLSAMREAMPHLFPG
jgi:xanthine dehydrogenase accessory factor